MYLFPEREACLRHNAKCLNTNPETVICLRSDDKCSILICRRREVGSTPFNAAVALESIADV
jgi:hypothetical protein